MTNHNNEGKGAGLAGGIFLGILLTLVVGAGACYLMFNPIRLGANNSDESEYYQQEIEQVQQIYQKANQSTPDPKASWLLSLAILEPKARQMLELDMTDEQAQTAAQTYSAQALKAGLPSAVVANAYETINLGLGLEPSEEGPQYYPTADIKEAQQVQAGIEQIVGVLKSNCEVIYRDQDRLDYVLYDVPTYTIPLYFNSLSQEAIRSHPSLADLIDIANLRAGLYCQYDDYPAERVLEFLLDKDVDTAQWHTPARQLVYLSVLAELLDKPDMVYLINRRVPADDQDDFSKERSALLTTYKTTFGEQIPVDAVDSNE